MHAHTLLESVEPTPSDRGQINATIDDDPVSFYIPWHRLSNVVGPDSLNQAPVDRSIDRYIDDIDVHWLLPARAPLLPTYKYVGMYEHTLPDCMCLCLFSL